MQENNTITISVDDVKDFKEIFSDENQLIKKIVQENYLDILKGRILDVGGGTADILSEIIPKETVTHLDILDFSSTPIPENHSRIQGDFLDEKTLDNIGRFDVLFMSHVHQFLDHNMEKLNRSIERANAESIIMVEDVNDDFLGEVMKFSLSRFENANPEVKLEGFPIGYTQTRSISFTGNVICSDFSALTKQCLYLMDLPHSEENILAMKEFLESRLTKPAFTFHQEVNLYQKQ